MGGEPGRRVLVTGASYGLGEAVARQLVQRGDEVHTLSRSEPPPDTGGAWLPADLGDLASIPRVVGALKEAAQGPFDGVVLNAALADKSRSQWTVEQVERHFRINTLGPFALWDALVAADLVGAPCNVVLIGSFLQNGNARQPAYAMSKAALWSWMRSFTLAQPGDAGVSMNMVWPGRVITPANPLRELPPGDPNLFYPADRVAVTVLGLLDQAPGGPRGTVIDLGRS